MVITNPFRITNCTERELSRPETERLIFRIDTETEQSLGFVKRFAGYSRGVIESASLNIHRAVERARWLAELAAALDQADKLALALFGQRGDSMKAILLRDHILTLRSEVDSLQKGRQDHAGKIDPNWM